MSEASEGHPFKVTFPAPSIFGHPLTTVVGTDEGGYASLEEFVAHAIEIERGLVADAIAAGARDPIRLPALPRTWSIRRGSRASKRPDTPWIERSTGRSRPTRQSWRTSPTM